MYKRQDIATTAALKEMLLPGGLAIALPLIIGFWDKEALGGFLAGSLVTGFLLAIFMANSGGAWDNAKKYIEAGGGAGKGSDEHKAAVIGDTIGDPFKDTSGPSLNILLKLMSVVALVIAPSIAIEGSEISAYVEGQKNEPQKVELIVQKREDNEMLQ